MLLHANNPDIDFDELDRVVRHTAACRRHDLALATATPHAEASARAPAPATGWRQRVRAVPIAGPLIATVHRRLRRSVAPGLSAAQRVRALPGIGELAAWAHALVTLPRWRRRLVDELASTREELARTQHALHALRASQGELMRDMGALRAALARPVDEADPPHRRAA